MKSEATTVGAYLAELPADRREAIEAVRAVVLENLPEGYEEVMNWGMIAWQVPLEVIGEAVASMPLRVFVDTCERGRNAARSRAKHR